MPAELELERFIDGVPCGLASVDPDGVIIEANALMRRWLGQPARGSNKRARLTDILKSGSLIYYKIYLVPSLRLNRRLDEFALKIQTADGVEVEVLTSARINEDNIAQFVFFPAGARRKFERRQAEDFSAAQARVTWLRQIELMGGVGAWSLTIGEEQLNGSDMFFTLLGQPPATSLNPSHILKMVVDAKERRALLRKIVRAMRSGKDFTLETAVQAGEADLRQISIRGAAEWRRGSIHRVVGIIRDMTEQRAAEKARDLAQARISQLAQNLPGVLLSLEIGPADEVSLVHVSSHCKALLGYDADELAADPGLLKSLPGSVGPRLLEVLPTQASSLALPVERGQTPGRLRDERWVEIRGSIVRMSPERIRVDCIYLDVTAEILAQKELEKQTEISLMAQRHESLGRLTGGVAHDFNNLLSVIMGNLELLQDELETPEKLVLVDSASRAVERGAGLIRSLLAFAGRAHLQPRVVNLNDIVLETQSWAQRTMPAAVQIDTRLASDLCGVKVDPDSTASALLNLIINARDAIQSEGKICIATENIDIENNYFADRPDGRYVALTVSDSGEGIPSAVLPRIFEPFFTTKAPGKGSGLGLSMIQGFVQQSSGTIEVDSVAGQGSTFRLYFPVAPREPEPEPEQDSHALASTEGRRARILLAEDEQLVREMVRTMLEKAGHSVTPASSGDAAYAVFKDDPDFDLLVTDFSMPGTLQGDGLAQALRTIRKELPIIFMTGYATTDVELGARGTVLKKPMRRSDLLDAVIAALNRSDEGE